MKGRLRARSALLTLSVVALAGCGMNADSSSTPASEAGDEADVAAAADQSTCRHDATELPTPYSAGFPSEWLFPPETTVFHVEERPATGTIVTAVSEAPFDEVLSFLNHEEVAAGFEITDGETEEDDAEANWTSGEHRGRWTIRKSSDCPGQTVIQVLAVPVS
jgi:hypothetical protein